MTPLRRFCRHGVLEPIVQRLPAAHTRGRFAVTRLQQRMADGQTYIIAEIGQNHQGSLEMARELLRAAKNCGVDAVKSQ